MRMFFQTLLVAFLVVASPFEANAQEQRGAASESPIDEAEQGDAAAPASGGSLRRSGRMEFDSRLVRGETAGTGAVVLFNRGQRQLPELTDRRSGFLAPTVREIYGNIAVGSQGEDQGSAQADSEARNEERVEEARRSARARRQARAAAVRRATRRGRQGSTTRTRDEAAPQPDTDRPSRRRRRR